MTLQVAFCDFSFCQRAAAQPRRMGCTLNASEWLSAGYLTFLTSLKGTLIHRQLLCLHLFACSGIEHHLLPIRNLQPNTQRCYPASQQSADQMAVAPCLQKTPQMSQAIRRSYESHGHHRLETSLSSRRNNAFLCLAISCIRMFLTSRASRTLIGFALSLCSRTKSCDYSIDGTTQRFSTLRNSIRNSILHFYRACFRLCWSPSIGQKPCHLSQ